MSDPQASIKNRWEWKLPADDPYLFDDRYEDDRRLALLVGRDRMRVPLESYGADVDKYKRR